jgi:Tfp pilus assembly protein PilN
MKTAKEYINLLPRKEKQSVQPISAWTVCAVLFLLVWIGLFGWKATQLRRLQAGLNLRSLQQQHLELELATLRKELGLTSAPGDNLNKTALVQSLLKERVLWSQVFQEFSHIIPRGVWFDSLEGSAAGNAEVRIRGGSLDYRLVSDFMLGMERSGYFEKPELLFAQKATVQGHDVIEFEIHCGVKKSQGAL